MAFISLSRPGAPMALPVRVMYALENVVKNLRQRRLYRQTIAELGALSDRELNDLGLNRATISAAARNAVYS